MIISAVPAPSLGRLWKPKADTGDNQGSTFFLRRGGAPASPPPRTPRFFLFSITKPDFTVGARRPLRKETTVDTLIVYIDREMIVFLR